MRKHLLRGLLRVTKLAWLCVVPQNSGYGIAQREAQRDFVLLMADFSKL